MHKTEDGQYSQYNRIPGDLNMITVYLMLYHTCYNNSLTKLCNMRETASTGYGTFYNLSVESDTCTVTTPYTCYMRAFEAVLV